MNRLRQFGLVYLMTPYTRYPFGHETAFIDASKIAGKIMAQGVNIFCPISHSHPICRFSKLPPTDHDFWMSKNRPFMARSDAGIVAQLEGWENSAGIADEMTFFRSAGRPIFNLDPETMVVSE